MKKIMMLAALAWCGRAQNPIPAHPRMILNDTVADTWESGKSRLAAVSQRALGGNATAAADFTSLKTYLTSSSPSLGQYSSTDANLNIVLDYGLAYLVYHKAGNDTAANPYAAALWSAFSKSYGPVTYISQIVTNGGTATATVTSTAGLSNGNAAVWGVSDDNLCGAQTITVIDGTHFTFPSAVPPGTYTTATMLATQSGAWAGWNDQYNDSGVALAQWAYFYDWCYDWLAANGHDQFARDQIKAGYWQETLTRQSSQFSQAIRESDFHNYASWSESSIMEAGSALYGDDALGATILAEGAGYLINGISGIQPAAVSPDTFTYNVRASKDVLTGGAMNWEGPTYWRAGTIRFLRALEAYDTATARANNTWGAGGPYNNAVNGGWYKLYLKQPDGTMANFGDGGNSNSYAGRDNMGMAILNDRFPDPHFVYFMTTMVGDPWNDGGTGELALGYKLTYFPYVNGPGSHDLTDLALSRRFGPDVILRSGWGPADTFITYTSSLHGTYHRHDDGGTFNVFSQAPLIQGQPYTLAEPAYTNYNRRTLGGNTLTITDPGDCWKDTGASCGVDVYGSLLGNDGGQLTSFRRFYNEFNTGEFSISRIWSGSLYSDGRICNSASGETCAALYGKFDAVDQPVFFAGTGYEHIRNDLTPSYVNAYSGSGDNPTAKVAAANGVIREMVHFQKTLGSLNPLVVFDRVQSTNAAFAKAWSIHTTGAPSVNGTAMAPGDTTTANAATSSADNGTGRVFVSHLLPANRKLRTVGGNACAAIPILGATNANPAVFYAPAHGLQPGEAVGIATGAQPDNGSGPAAWPNWLIDRYFAYHNVATVPDPDHFTLTSGYGSDSTGYPAWSTAFSSGNGAPAVSGSSTGQMYYQQDAAPGNRVWSWNYGSWQHLTGAGYVSSANYLSPVVYTHASCNWAFYVDQMGPAGTVNTPMQLHLWNGSMDLAALNTVPNWRIAEQPATGAAQDYFLNVIEPVTTSVGTVPATSLISAPGVYGAQIADASGYYVAVFPADPAPQLSISYSALHSGAGRHVVTGLSQVGTYLVAQGGSVIATAAADSTGALAFTETGGGAFQIYQTLTITSAAQLAVCTIGRACLSVETATGGSGGYTWSIAAGSMPPGLTLSTSGAITGAPTAAGMYSFTAMVTDGSAKTASQSESLQVQTAPAGIRPGKQARSGALIH